MTQTYYFYKGWNLYRNNMSVFSVFIAVNLELYNNYTINFSWKEHVGPR